MTIIGILYVSKTDAARVMLLSGGVSSTTTTVGTIDETLDPNLDTLRTAWLKSTGGTGYVLINDNSDATYIYVTGVQWNHSTFELVHPVTCSGKTINYIRLCARGSVATDTASLDYEYVDGEYGTTRTPEAETWTTTPTDYCSSNLTTNIDTGLAWTPAQLGSYWFGLSSSSSTVQQNAYEFWVEVNCQ